MKRSASPGAMLQASFVVTAVVAAMALGQDSGLHGSSPATVAPPRPGFTSPHGSPLGLPRLRAAVPPGAAQPLREGRFENDPLEPGTDVAPGSVRARQKGRWRALEIEQAGEWRRPLQGVSDETVFVSALVYGSVGTEVDFGGARIRFAASPIAGFLEVQALLQEGDSEPQWRSVGLHAPVEFYDGRALAAMPVLTVRLGRRSPEWDLFAGMRPVLAAQSLATRTGGGPAADRFVVRGGEHGAWVCGLVQSFDNPLYEDENANGIDDPFELGKRGALLPTDAPRSERGELAWQWRSEARVRPPHAMLIHRPEPDGR